MIDVSVLKGSEVRSRGGSRGFIDVVTPSHVRVRWEDSDGSLRFESCLRSDARLGQIEVLTLTSGWVPLKSIVGMEDNVNVISKLTTELKDMLSESGALDERSKHWPFKNTGTLGPTGSAKHGPPPKGTRSVSQTDDWVCKKKGKYTQICKSGDKKKIVRIEPSYKKKYNRAYRKWLAKQQG